MTRHTLIQQAHELSRTWQEWMHTADALADQGDDVTSEDLAVALSQISKLQRLGVKFDEQFLAAVADLRRHAPECDDILENDDPHGGMGGEDDIDADGHDERYICEAESGCDEWGPDIVSALDFDDPDPTIAQKPASGPHEPTWQRVESIRVERRPTRTLAQLENWCSEAAARAVRTGDASHTHIIDAAVQIVSEQRKRLTKARCELGDRRVKVDG